MIIQQSQLDDKGHLYTMVLFLDAIYTWMPV